MPDPPEGELAADEMTPGQAMQKMAAVTANTRSLRVRTEGLTLVMWGIIIAASYLTIIVPILGGAGGPDERMGPGGPGPDFTRTSDNATFENNTSLGQGARFGPDGARGPPATAFFAARSAPLVWYAIGVVVTIAIWKSASLSFQTGLTTPRLVAVFAAWLALFLGTVFVLAFLEGTSPRSWHLAGWAVVIGLLAAVNPLRFTNKGRAAAAVIALVAALTAAYAYLADLGGRDIGFLAGLSLGASGLLAGLYLMFRG